MIVEADTRPKEPTLRVTVREKGLDRLAGVRGDEYYHEWEGCVSIGKRVGELLRRQQERESSCTIRHVQNNRSEQSTELQFRRMDR